MEKLETADLWRLVTLVRNSKDYGPEHPLAKKLDKELFSRIYS